MEWLQRSEKVPNHDLITIFYPEITEEKITQVWSQNYGSRCPHKYTRDCPWVEPCRDGFLIAFTHFSSPTSWYNFPTLVSISFSILPPMWLQGKILWERSLNLPVTCIPCLLITHHPYWLSLLHLSAISSWQQEHRPAGHGTHTNNGRRNGWISESGSSSALK